MSLRTIKKLDLWLPEIVGNSSDPPGSSRQTESTGNEDLVETTDNMMVYT
jgi:hypothetical protein